VVVSVALAASAVLETIAADPDYSGSNLRNFHLRVNHKFNIKNTRLAKRSSGVFNFSL